MTRRKLTPEERVTLESIAVAAYAGGTRRKPEDDVRWLLWLVGELAPSRSGDGVKP